MVRAEDAAEPLPGLDGDRRLGLSLPVDQPVAQSLVVPLQVVVGGVLLDRQPQVPLADGDNLREALLLDRPDKPLGVGVEVGAPRGVRIDSIPADRSRARNCPPNSGSRSWIRRRCFSRNPSKPSTRDPHERPRDPRHPLAGRVLGDAGDPHPARLQIDDEEDMEPNAVNFQRAWSICGAGMVER